MDATHIHIFITHLPVFGLFLGFLALVYGSVVKSKHVNIVSLFIILIATIGAIIAVQTGESAEHKVEEIPGILESAIEEHEESAETTILFFYVLGVLSCLGLYLEATGKKYARFAIIAVLVLSAVT
ncbi:MAG: hypothetical protein M3Y60_15000, partial [Bacteroidota bacterium]|nr:hypothetical protein [Bacteroidota bacterium]